MTQQIKSQMKDFLLENLERTDLFEQIEYGKEVAGISNMGKTVQTYAQKKNGDEYLFMNIDSPSIIRSKKKLEEKIEKLKEEETYLVPLVNLRHKDFHKKKDREGDDRPPQMFKDSRHYLSDEEVEDLSVISVYEKAVNDYLGFIPYFDPWNNLLRVEKGEKTVSDLRDWKGWSQQERVRDKSWYPTKREEMEDFVVETIDPEVTAVGVPNFSILNLDDVYNNLKEAMTSLGAAEMDENREHNDKLISASEFKYEEALNRIEEIKDMPDPEKSQLFSSIRNEIEEKLEELDR